MYVVYYVKGFLLFKCVSVVDNFIQWRSFSWCGRFWVASADASSKGGWGCCWGTFSLSQATAESWWRCFWLPKHKTQEHARCCFSHCYILPPRCHDVVYCFTSLSFIVYYITLCCKVNERASFMQYFWTFFLGLNLILLVV